MIDSMDSAGHAIKEDAHDAKHDVEKAADWTKDKAHDAKEGVERAV